MYTTLSFQNPIRQSLLAPPVAIRQPSSPDSDKQQPTLEEGIKQLEIEANALRAKIAVAPQKPSVPHTAAKLDDRPLNPAGPTDTDQAISLQLALSHQGIIGLASVASDLAKEYQKDGHITPSQNYDNITLPQNKASFRRALLTMHLGVVKHLLRGDLFYQYFHNDELFDAVNSYHRLSNAPGTYVEALVRVHADPGNIISAAIKPSHNQWNKDAGAWLTAREIIQVYGAAKRYMPSNSVDESEFARDLDMVLPGFDEHPLEFYHNGGRRYIKDNEQQERFARWLEEWNKTYIKRALVLVEEEQKSGKINPKLDIPFQSCPFAIQYATNPVVQANSHDEYAHANNWVFVQALVRHQLDRNREKFAVYRIQTNYLTDVDDLCNEANIVDIGMKMIARAEWHQGGFNINLGGDGSYGDELKAALPLVEAIRGRIYAKDDSVSATGNSIFSRNVRESTAIIDALKTEDFRMEHKDELLANCENTRKTIEQRVEKLQHRISELKKLSLLRQVEEARKLKKGNTMSGN